MKKILLALFTVILFAAYSCTPNTNETSTSEDTTTVLDTVAVDSTMAVDSL